MSKYALQPRIVLGVAAHPDDLDFGAGGTMAAFARQGAEVYYLILTDGCKGTSDRSLRPDTLVKTRQAEQKEAARVLGITDVFFLDYVDCELKNIMQLKKDIVRNIRKLRPDVIVTMDPTMVYSAKYGIINHTDHRAAGQATLDAAYPLARDHLSFPDLLAEGLEPHSIKTALLTNLDRHNFAMDISATINQKMQALRAHASQMPKDSEPHAWVKEMAKEQGRNYGREYAEAFVRIDIV